jgi:hypothetical protein
LMHKLRSFVEFEDISRRKSEELGLIEEGYRK